MNHKAMFEVRTTVESLFGEIKTLKFVNFSSQVKIGLSSVGKIYLVNEILENVKTCLYGNRVADLKQIQSLSRYKKKLYIKH